LWQTHIDLFGDQAMIRTMSDEMTLLEYHHPPPALESAPVRFGRVVALGYVGLCVVGLIVMGIVMAMAL